MDSRSYFLFPNGFETMNNKNDSKNTVVFIIHGLNDAAINQC
jgi:hypothetical protein